MSNNTTTKADWEKIIKPEVNEELLYALEAMIDRWEPDCGGQDRLMYDRAVEACQKARAALTRR